MKITATIEMDMEVFEELSDEELKDSIYWNLQPHVEDMQVTTEGYKIKSFNLKIDTENETF